MKIFKVSEAFNYLPPSFLFQIRQIFESCGVQMTGETFENFYKAAADKHPKGHVSVESFRNVLDELQASDVESKKHPLAV